MRRMSWSSNRRITVYLGIAVFTQVVAYLVVRRQAGFSALSEYVSTRFSFQEVQSEEGCAANSSIVQGEIKR